jgi:hypothetical protein
MPTTYIIPKRSIVTVKTMRPEQLAFTFFDIVHIALGKSLHGVALFFLSAYTVYYIQLL